MAQRATSVTLAVVFVDVFHSSRVLLRKNCGLPVVL